ncbi:MAG: hypothetical protein LBD17_00825 [Endomicrobium sp.]|jgi:hypothetical protein|nr:hypothetical protein [Endomicrobium sp.]
MKISHEDIEFYKVQKLTKKQKSTKVYFLCNNCKEEKCQSLGSLLDSNEFLCRKCKISQTKQNFNKTKETMLKKYGVSSSLSLKSVQEKKKQFFLSNYGVENYSQIPEKKKELQEKREKFWLKNYGVINNSQLESYKKKRKENTLNKYGVEHTSQRKEVKEKQKQTNLKKYGVTMATNNQKIREKSEKTLLKKYGVKNCQQNPEIRQKTEQTFIKNYGCKKICWFRKYKYNNIIFDSSWEVAFYIWNKDHNIKIERNTNLSFKYIWEEKEHVYFPDFIIENEIIEIKGSHLLKQEKWIMKKDIIKTKNIKVITDCSLYLNYIKEKYGKNYLKSFIIKCKK